MVWELSEMQNRSSFLSQLWPRREYKKAMKNQGSGTAGPAFVANQRLNQQTQIFSQLGKQVLAQNRFHWLEHHLFNKGSLACQDDTFGVKDIDQVSQGKSHQLATALKSL